MRCFKCAVLGVLVRSKSYIHANTRIPTKFNVVFFKVGQTGLDGCV